MNIEEKLAVILNGRQDAIKAFTLSGNEVSDVLYGLLDATNQWIDTRHNKVGEHKKHKGVKAANRVAYDFTYSTILEALNRD